MNNTQPISEDSKKENRLSSMTCFLFAAISWFLPTLTLYIDGFSGFGFADWMFISFSIFWLVIGIILLKQKTELTPEARKQSEIELKEFNEKIQGKWYVRYPMAIFMLGLAYVCFMAWYSGMRMHGLGLLLINPVVGVLAVIIAIANAWELSLLVIIIGVGYYLFQGIAALPVSAAIIIGSIIIAYGARKYRA